MAEPEAQAEPPEAHIEQAPIVADDAIEPDDHTDADSTFGSIAESLTESLNSQFTRIVEENGRVYASFGGKEYAMPSDDQELDRMDMSHTKLCLLLDKQLFLAPIGDHPQRILDLGTGTGIWAIEVADEYPSAEVTGVDIAPTQPQWVPPNCKFELDDIELPWTWPKNSFDLIHARSLMMCVKDWPRLAEQCYEHLKPGGYAEFQTVYPRLLCDDGSAPPNSGLMQWSDYCFSAASLCGFPLEVHKDYIKHFQSTGFVDIVERKFKYPSSPWPKDKKLKLIGAFELHNMQQGLSGMSLRMFSKAFGWTLQETEAFLIEVRRDAKNLKYHTYWEFVVTFARKPLKVETSPHGSP